jgi:hypothetical protein
MKVNHSHKYDLTCVKQFHHQISSDLHNHVINLEY